MAQRLRATGEVFFRIAISQFALFILQFAIHPARPIACHSKPSPGQSIRTLRKARENDSLQSPRIRD